MGDTQEIESRQTVDEARPVAAAEPVRPRAVGSPLPTGAGMGSATGSGLEDPLRSLAAQTPPGRSLPAPPNGSAADGPTGMQRALGAFRAALPFVQRLLPMLDGNIGAAVSNMLTPHHPTPPPPPQVPVNLAPLEDGLARLEMQQHQFGEQLTEQNASLKRVEDQLEMVREATDRNTLEQQELLEDLKVVGNKMNLFAVILLALLVVSMLINIFLYVRIKSVYP